MKWPLVVLAVVACSHPPPRHEQVGKTGPAAGAVTLTIIGTNDLHGALSRLPLIAGHIANVRAARAADGGGVLLVDAGDLFQGTLESNIAEGADVVRAYNQMGYAASAVGNHEFDYGPEGPAVIAKSIEEDPRGALKARVKEARFPFLASNILDDKSGERIKWQNMPASTMVTVAGVKIGIVGASTESTPYTTMPANFAGLKIGKPAAAIAAEAAQLRAQGAVIIVAIAHIGSKCKDLEHPNDTSSCDHEEELFRVVGDLPKGAVDVFVAGHTHAAIAHRINDVAVIESYSSGRAFGRVDMRIHDGRVTAVQIHKPHDVCPNAKADGEGAPLPVSSCTPGDYEGKPVKPDPEVQKIVDSALERAGERRREKLGVTLTSAVTRAYGTESAEGNWFTELMLAAQPDAHVALTNGGGLRADIPPGELTYGALFEAMPFDNRFAIVELQGKHIRRLVANNLQRTGGFNSWGGLTVRARCKDGKLDLAISIGGKPLADEGKYKLVTSDFLASGGDGVIGRLKLPPEAIRMTDVIIRDALADILRKKKGTIDGTALFSPGKKRVDYEGSRPVECAPKQPKRNQEPDD
jgi:2',3'-cyclic-nucleotide 2'-phosphodiesterase (5'-nucleotidase family)